VPKDSDGSYGLRCLPHDDAKALLLLAGRPCESFRYSFVGYTAMVFVQDIINTFFIVIE